MAWNQTADKPLSKPIMPLFTEKDRHLNSCIAQAPAKFQSDMSILTHWPLGDFIEIFDKQFSH